MGKTTISASTESSGNALTVDYDTDAGLTEVGLVRDVDAGDRSINMDAKYLVKSKTARVKLMSAFGDDAQISATVDYGTDGGDTSYEFGYSQDLKDGRTMDVEFNPDDKSLEIEFTDTGSVDGDDRHDGRLELGGRRRDGQGVALVVVVDSL